MIMLSDAITYIYEHCDGVLYKEDGSFTAAAPYDFISLAISPRYAPEAADALIPIFESYMR